MNQELSLSVLSVCAGPRGIGFVLFASPLAIVDWGVKTFPSARRNVECVKAVQALIERYVPDMLVLDDASARTSRIQDLYRMIEGIALTDGVHVEHVSKEEVQSCFLKLGARTNDERANVIASRLPERFHRVPKKRRAWYAEDPRMAMFKATSLGITIYSQEIHDV